MYRFTMLAIVLFASFANHSFGLERLVLEREGQPIYVSGKVVTESVDGGLLLQDREGVLWAVQPDELVRRSEDAVAFEPMQRHELQAQLSKELPGFRFHATAHYLVCYNTSSAYAQWCGALYERLHMAFRNFWSRRGLELNEPESPLVALVFDQKASYQRYAQAELGEAAGSIIGYYSLRSNRVIMYDLTGNRGLQRANRQASSTAQINHLLMDPRAERLVATIVHEATHQLAYNCGMHTRYADIPLWVSEGLALYFETPDLQSARGWRNIGGINRVRLTGARSYFSNRPTDSLDTLLRDDSRFRQGATAQDAYSEAWALTYFLINRRQPQFVEYLKTLAVRGPLVYDTPAERVQAFGDAFGSNTDTLDNEFVRFTRALR